MRVSDFIICDDIRSEVGNKYSLMGLYDDQIQFQVSQAEKGIWPKALKLGIFMRARFENESEKENVSKFRLESALNGKAKILAEGAFNFVAKAEAKGVTVAVIINQFMVEESGNLTFKATFFDSSNKTLSVFEHKDGVLVTEVGI